MTFEMKGEGIAKRRRIGPCQRERLRKLDNRARFRPSPFFKGQRVGLGSRGLRRVTWALGWNDNGQKRSPEQESAQTETPHGTLCAILLRSVALPILPYLRCRRSFAPPCWTYTRNQRRRAVPFTLASESAPYLVSLPKRVSVYALGVSKRSSRYPPVPRKGTPDANSSGQGHSSRAYGSSFA